MTTAHAAHTPPRMLQAEPAERELIASTYRLLARLGYRPGLTDDDPALARPVTGAEITRWALGYYQGEEHLHHPIGTPDYSTLGPLLLIIEAARLCCGMPAHRRLIEPVLRAAIEALPAPGRKPRT